MSDQRQQTPSQQPLFTGAAEAGDPEAAARLATAREQFDLILATADSILERVRQGDSARFLEQVRQSGGE